ncbi:dolichyl-P-Man:Man(5)GlcNAc(2)-PP-dolichol alpha-1,3-mannosyltransferase [Saccharomycopsis crataegensis]|uniref:Dol-P-Man:Man(5)GlcNAc(2)-PP-Dol alpha-1,3-mannosyltransferase n=1 Tax=Saccharomycopsis crataegensis TaxID=43959 RepID=A0AAV5QVI7_9ASCO|nr:dolichyl-P-Man:Man(5)GlcNAc(2)-PP-dolichol alpha-1,3-mannosyltransferase [Saccharomycopsis crataegensis]
MSAPEQSISYDGEKSEEKPPLPEFTFKNLLLDVLDGIKYMLNDPNAILLYYVLTCLAESMLNKVIIHNVDYTEIDFTTYRQQVQLVKNGELNYNNIYGDSGPIVYPAGFIQIYSLLDSIYKTDGLVMIQQVFRFLLTVTFVLYIFVYQFSNRTGEKFLLKKPWIFSILLLSKRMHSIYVLRLFNDCFVTFFMGLVILLLQVTTKIPDGQARAWLLFFTSAVYSYALSIKMNALLFAPGLFYILYLFHGGRLVTIVVHIITILAVQVCVAWDFLQPFDLYGLEAMEIRNAYLSNAFNFNRKFFYEWTINWRFLPEDVFQNDSFHKLLLCINGVLLAGFVVSRWCTNFNPLTVIVKSLVNPFKAHLNNNLNNTSVSSAYIFYVLSISNLIGVICSRSLHYQFLSWYYFQLPFLYALAGWNYYFIPVFHLLHELCWCTYPPNEKSSLSLVMMLLFLLGSIWRNNHFRDYNVLLKEDESKKNK